MRNYLIVVDMQKDFTFGALRNQDAIDVIPAVEDKIKGYDGEVIYTQDTHQEDYMSTQEGRKLPVPHCIEGTTGWELVDSLAALQQEKKSKVIIKPTFGSTKLAEFLVKEHEKEPIGEVELVGVCTDICVISNAMLIKAALPEVTVKVDSACCAGVSKESHNTALSAMKACQIEVV